MFQRHTALVWLLLLALLAGSSGMAVAQSGDSQPNTQPTRPRLTWSEQRVVQSLQPGETREVRVTLMSDTTIEGVNLRVVGGLSRVLSASPRSFDLAAGVPRTITLTMTLPREHRGARAGVVQVRVGQRNVPPSLKVFIEVPGDDSSNGDRDVKPAAPGKPDKPGRGKPKGDK